jgi:outer membrane protein assembly factor BamE
MLCTLSRNRRLITGVIMLSALLTLSACSWTKGLSIYRMDVRQGNYVSQEMLAQLKQGLTEEQVRFIMGSPLLIDPFHANRWDYVYRFALAGKLTEQKRITLIFKDSKLLSIEGDVVPALALSAPVVQSAPVAAP